MAGDIGIREHVIILPAEGPAMATATARALSPDATGRVRHVYGPRLIVAETPPGGAPPSLAAAGAASAAEGDTERVSADVRRQLSAPERLGLDAFALRQSGAYLEAKENRPHADADWDSGVADQPGCMGAAAAPSDVTRAGAEAPTSAQLTGSVAVGIIIVEGPTAALKFSAAERTKVVAEVQNGLGWLASQSPTGVTFKYDIQVVSITTQPGPDSLDGDQKEALWRDPAMAKLGFGAGMAGVTAYVEGLRTKLGTTWAYCGFFVKYPLYHFAYASIGGPRIVMDYANDGWGPDNIDRVFAHESGHIFGAPDEYASSGCNCGGSWGIYGKPNSNCANCAPAGGVDCLMKQNSWAMCAVTPYHLGFPLVDQTYSGVWRAGTDAHYLWVNAGWDSFKTKWEQLAQQNLRLVDLKITRDGGAERYHGVWRQGTGGHYLWVNADWNSFKAKWEQLSQQGLRLVDFEVTNFGGTLRYSGVWLPGTDGHYLWVNADWNGFKAKWEELAQQNLRLTDLRIVKVNGQDRYSGVWRQGTGGHYLWVNATWDSFKAKWQELAGQGLRLVDLEITGTAGDRRYSGVWLPGTDAYYLWVGASYQNFRAKWEELSAQGLRLVAIDVVPAAGPQSPTPAGAPGEEREPVAVGGDDDRGGMPGVAAPATGAFPHAAHGRTRTHATAYAGRPAKLPPRYTPDVEAGAGFGGGDTGRDGAAADDDGAGVPDDTGGGFGGGEVGMTARPAAGQTGDQEDDGRGFGGGDFGAAGGRQGRPGGREEDGMGGGTFR